MPRRLQAGSVTLSGDRRYWIGKWRDEHGKQHSKLLGKIKEMKKSAARQVLADFLRPVNAIVEDVGTTVKDFLKDTYFPLFERKWKGSTADTNRYRIENQLIDAFGDRLLASMTRKELQTFLDSKEDKSYSTVAHLRWDLKQVFDCALAEGLVTKNPAAMLFVPKECKRATRRTMSVQDVKTALGGLELRERLVFKLGTLAGMRPGEIFGLQGGHVTDQSIEVRQRILRGEIDKPKTERSVRTVPLAATVRADMEAWQAQCPGGPEAWLFPSERLVTPVSKDNFMERHLRPALKALGLGWVNFQVMRRTHASLMRDLNVDPKVVADMMGHDLAVNLNVYTNTSMESRLQAAETLGNALVN